MPQTEFTEGVHEERHRDGSLRARGPVVDGRPHGYWEWFRLDGTMLRSGHFDRGRGVGEWTTYDKSGAPYKVTQRG
ncbi:toxin-antitoxin system YwqK family antitoxin [Geodermatophilus sp. CPCC 206100]|uniref:toxin-antitoxin system YwqK family antitoxin n=1 Tax=Geodermatophilus sp. CPCC 206100 TaxID=3020054 RepID=UPI003B003696